MEGRFIIEKNQGKTAVYMQTIKWVFMCTYVCISFFCVVRIWGGQGTLELCVHWFLQISWGKVITKLTTSSSSMIANNIKGNIIRVSKQ